MHPETFRLPKIPEKKPEFSLYEAAVGGRPSTRALANDRKSVSMAKVFKQAVNAKRVVNFQEISDQCRDLTRKLDMFTSVNTDIPALRSKDKKNLHERKLALEKL